MAMISMFEHRDELILLIPAEGTRSYVKEWKSGFYYTALGAKVPIALGFLDYGKKTAGFGELFYPTGDYQRGSGRDKELLSPVHSTLS